MVLGSIIEGITEVIEGFFTFIGRLIGAIIILIIVLTALMVCSCLTTGRLPL